MGDRAGCQRVQAGGDGVCQLGLTLQRGRDPHRLDRRRIRSVARDTIREVSLDVPAQGVKNGKASIGEEGMRSRTMIWVGLLIALVAVAPMVCDSITQTSYTTDEDYSRDKLYCQALGTEDYTSDLAGALPPAASVGPGPPRVDLHGWQTHLLLYVEQRPLHDRIDFFRPWHAPTNSEPFQEEVDLYLTWKIDERTSSDGYALTHYSANQHILKRDASLKTTDITDGAADTILYGEIRANLPPWGKPMNVRDPAIGLQSSANGFGGPWSSGETQFSTLDGAVHSLSRDIDPHVLRALSTPNGGESVGWPSK